jgi:hypothetical protein
MRAGEQAARNRTSSELRSKQRTSQSKGNETKTASVERGHGEADAI